MSRRVDKIRVAAVVGAALVAPPAFALEAAVVGGRIEVRDKGAAIGSFAPRTPAARRGPPAVREVAVGGRRVVEVRMRLAGDRRSDEVWIGEIGAQGLEAIATEVVGAQDSDGETSIDIAVSAQGIDRFQ